MEGRLRTLPLRANQRLKRVAFALALASASTSGHAVSYRRAPLKAEPVLTGRLQMRARPMCEPRLPRAATLGDSPTTNESIHVTLMNPLLWYDRHLRRTPIRTKSLSNGVVSALGDALAQMLTTGQIDKTRLFAWYLSGLFYFGPILHTWYNGLYKFDIHMREKYNTPKVLVVFLQLAFNQFIGSAIVNALFLYFIAFAKMGVAFSVGLGPFVPGASFIEATHTLQTSYIKMMLANWLFWPIPSAMNLVLIPLPYRVLFSNTCSLVWKTILSTILS